jgi:hypothetical protein
MEVQVLYNEKYKTLKEERHKKMKGASHVHGSAELLKWPYYLMQPTDSM